MNEARPDELRAVTPASPDRRAARLRVLLSEGSSTSARQAVTALGLDGHHVEVMDPDRHALARFSRFVRRFHRCPPMGSDPEGYRDFVLSLVEGGRFDVLLPIHEQGYLLARIADRLAPHVAFALPAFETYERAVSRTGFARLLERLRLPRPRSEVVDGPRRLCGVRPPCVLKAEIGTASRGVWMVRDAAALARAAEEIAVRDACGPVLVQEWLEGPVEHAQGVFDRGRLVAMHAYRRLEDGAGGGPALKESVARPAVRGHLARIGRALGWHGALSVDYVFRATDGAPAYIDCNPRLVEPMSARLAGVDLTDALLRVSTGEPVPEQPPGCAGVRTRLALQALMGLGLRRATRREIVGEGWRAATGRGRWAGSTEELTPVGLDRPSLLPLLAAAAALAASPALAERLAGRGWGTHLLTPGAMRRIRAWNDGG